MDEDLKPGHKISTTVGIEGKRTGVKGPHSSGSKASVRGTVTKIAGEGNDRVVHFKITKTDAPDDAPVDSERKMKMFQKTRTHKNSAKTSPTTWHWSKVE